MAVYIFSYDLNDRDSETHTEDSEKIKTTVSSLGAWCKYLTTTYLISSTYSLDYINTELTAHMTAPDRMVLCEIKEPIKGWFTDKQWNWIRTNL